MSLRRGDSAQGLTTSRPGCSINHTLPVLSAKRSNQPDGPHFCDSKFSSEGLNSDNSIIPTNVSLPGAYRPEINRREDTKNTLGPTLPLPTLVTLYVGAGRLRST